MIIDFIMSFKVYIHENVDKKPITKVGVEGS